MKDCIYKKYEPIFGSWYITEKLGEGAIAQVYAMERKELGVTYHAALKAITIPANEEEVRSVMADGMTGEDLTHYYQTIIRNVVGELEFMSRLKGHSHIVSYEDHQIIEHEEDIGWDILIRIERLTPLIEYSLEHSLKEEDVLRLGVDICKALEYCRQFDILHRDVKPENIFIAPGGGYKLGDFGIARIVEETQVGLSRKGTYTYMAPEVYRGGVYGPSADIYSLGIVMYKFLNDGRNPFMPAYPGQVEVDDYDTAFARRISGGTVPEPAHGSAALKRLILKACAYDPKERFHSPAEFRAELELLQLQTRGLGWVMPADGNEAEVNQPLHEEAAEAEEKAGDGRRLPKKALRITLIAATALFLIAGIVDAVIPDKITAIKGIDDNEEIYIGEQMAPHYTIAPDWFKDEAITFATEDPGIASVGKAGKITAKKVGETEMTMQARDYTQTVQIRVVPKVTKISGISGSIEMEEGDTKSLKITLAPKKFADEPITYTSKDKSVFTVSKRGKLMAKEPGKAKLIIESGGCQKKVTVKVTEYEEPAPVYTYRASGSRKSSGKSKGSSGKSSGSSGKSSSGYFNKSDDEYFK